MNLRKREWNANACMHTHTRTLLIYILGGHITEALASNVSEILTDLYVCRTQFDFWVLTSRAYIYVYTYIYIYIHTHTHTHRVKHVF